MSKSTTYTTPILDEAYIVRTVITDEEGTDYSRIFITNNENGLVLGGDDTKVELGVDSSELHEQNVAKAVEALAPKNWVHRVDRGETTVHDRK